VRPESTDEEVLVMFYEAQRNINSNMREMIKVFKNYKTESESYLNQIIHDDQFEYI